MEKKQKKQPKKAAAAKRSNRPKNPQRSKPLTTMVDAPVARGNISRNSDPNTQYLGNGVIRVSHREYLREVRGSDGTANFVVESININPGIISAFPWLSNIANNYDSYLFERLVFEFVPSSPTSEPGKVMLMIDFDAEDVAPADKMQAMNYYRAESGTPWTRFSYDSLRQDLHKRKTYYVRRGNVGANDLQNYDTGKFYYCTTGQSHASILGEIYVTYIVRLMTPQSNSTAVGLSRYARLSGTNTGNRFGTFNGVLIFQGDPTYPTIKTTEFYLNSPWSGYVTFNIYGVGITNAAPEITCSAQSTAILLGFAVTDSFDQIIIIVGFRTNSTTIQHLSIKLDDITSYEDTFAYWAQASVVS